MKKEDYATLQTRRGFIRQAACAAVGTAALSNILEDLRLINSAAAQTGISDYKAMVCVFLNGGNDSNNLIIPTTPNEYAAYATLRTPILAIPNADGTGATALSIPSQNPDGHTYGLHPACPELQQLFSESKAAPLFNVGSLVYPITRAQYKAASISTPPQLFSHSDQQTQWQTSIPDRPPSSGWGGRCADLLNSVNSGGTTSFAISLAGTNTWQRGNVLQQYSVSTSGAVQLTSSTAAQKAALLNVLGAGQVNLQEQAYGAAVSHAVNEALIINTAIASGTTFNAGANDPLLTSGTALFPSSITTPNGGSTFTSSLSSQLKMVARLIEAGKKTVAQGGLGMKRQIFFVQVGGYDTHTNQTNATSANANAQNVVIGSQANLFAELSRCLYGFQRAMELISLSDKVTAFTASDFGRTFPSNGQGSDHGWGSHHLVVGSAVDGGKTYGRFPVQVVNGPDDTDTGRWIPTTSIDQYSASLASWFGVDPNNLSTIFPNLGRFAAPPNFMKVT